jgi:hypothetical protein
MAAPVTVSADSFSSVAALATSTSKLNKFAGLSGLKVASEPSPAKKLEILLAREQVFESFATERHFVPAKQTARTSTFSRLDEAQLVNCDATLENAFDEFFASVA